MGKKGKGNFRLDIGKKFFIVNMVRYWNRFPRKTVVVLSLGVFKVSLNGALSNLVCWEMYLRFVLTFNLL